MKYFKRIFAFALAMIMVLSVSVFAEEPIATAEATEITESTEIPEAIGKKYEEISIPVSNTYEEFVDITSQTESAVITVLDSSSYFKFKAAATGFIYLGMKSDAANSKTVTVKRTNSKGKKPSTIKKNFAPGNQFYAMVPVTKNSTYRIVLSGAAKGDKFSLTAANVVGGTSRTLTSYDNGNCAIAAGKKTSKKNYVTYWKVSDLPKGALTVYISDVYNDKPVYANVTLCNSKKKAVSKTTKITGIKGENGNTYLSQATYGVNSGTYYIRVSTKAPIYGIKMKTDSSYSEATASKRSKAIELAEGTHSKAVLAASRSKSSNYYKIVLDQDKHVKFDVDGYIAPGTKLNLVIYNSKGKKTKTLSITGEVNKIKTIDYGTKEKLKAGTYYLAVAKNSKETSAAYTVYYQTGEESLITTTK